MATFTITTAPTAGDPATVSVPATRAASDFDKVDALRLIVSAALALPAAPGGGLALSVEQVDGAARVSVTTLGGVAAIACDEPVLAHAFASLVQHKF